MIKRIGLAWKLVALLAALAASGCSDTATREFVSKQQLSAPLLLAVRPGGMQKAVSGPPEALVVTWTRSGDPEVQGYYLYRDTQNIPDPGPDGLLDPSLRVNAGNIIADPGSGSDVVFTDDFGAEKPLVGTTYYYRVTLLDTSDEESYPSNQMTWQVHAHHVNAVSPDTAFWGDTVTIDGDTFGAFDGGTDSVMFPSVTGYTAGSVVNWADTSIDVTVPAGAITGKPQVVIEGTVAETNNNLTILNPYITSIDPPIGFAEQALTIHGANFGATQDVSTVTMNGADVSLQVTSWLDSEIILTVPATVTKGDVIATVNSLVTNGIEFTPRAEILDVDTALAQAGEELTITGRFFGDLEGTLALGDSTAQVVTAWSDTSITFTLNGTEGPQTLIATTSDSIQSNQFSIDIEGLLAVTLSGLDPLVYYTPVSAPAIGVATAANADSVDLRIDGSVMATSTTAPFDDLVLPVALLNNGPHDVDLQAHRRNVTVSSNAITVQVYSLIGDINADGTVDLGDKDALGPIVGMDSGSLAFRPWFDTDADGIVSEADLAAVGYFFGSTN